MSSPDSNLRHEGAALQSFPEIQVMAVGDVNREGGRYLSWNWTEGKEEKLCGREPARRLVEEHYGGQQRSGQYRGCKTPRVAREGGRGRGDGGYSSALLGPEIYPLGVAARFEFPLAATCHPSCSRGLMAG